MAVLGAARLLDSGGAPALVDLSPVGQQVLTWLLLWVACLGLFHLALSLIRGRLPLALFCLLGALASSVVGIVVLWDTLRENAERSLASGILWGPGFAIGLFVVGALGSGAWVALTLGLSRLLGGPRKQGES